MEQEHQGLKDDLHREIDILRQELQDLKRCQLQYFSLAITGTAAILGLSAIQGAKLEGFAFFAPLSVILPTWMIFFDKATTITRIVGYQRVLERQLTEGLKDFRYVGFERALGRFRAKEKEAWANVAEETRPSLPSLLAVLLLATRHRFWMINWYTFAFLSTICCVGAYHVMSKRCMEVFLPFGACLFASERTIWVFLAFLCVLVCAIYTLCLIWQLTRGGLSYTACEKKWKWILHPDNWPKGSD